MANDEVIEALDLVLEVMVPHEPERAAQRALEALRAHHHARASAVFLPPPAGIRRLKPLVASPGLDKTGLERAQEAWEAGRDALQNEAWAQGRDAEVEYLFVPLFHGGALAALLYMDSEAPEFLATLDRERIVLMGRILAASAVARDPWFTSSAKLKGQLGRASAEQVREAHLLVVLDECGGVITKTAERIGVSRPTIYKWLRRYGIELPRGRKRPTLAPG